MEVLLLLGLGYWFLRPPKPTPGLAPAMADELAGGQQPVPDGGTTVPPQQQSIDIPLEDLVGTGGAASAIGGLLWGAAAVAVLTELNLQKKKRAQFSALWPLYATAEQDIWTHKKLRAIDSWNIRDHERVRNYENRLVTRYKDWTQEQALERIELNLEGFRFFPEFTLNHVAGWTQERTLY